MIELFLTFSGYFTHEECYKALLSNNHDVADAAQWLVDEGEDDRGKKAIVKNKVVLIAESEVVGASQGLIANINSEGLPPGGMPPSGLGGRRPGESDI